MFKFKNLLAVILSVVLMISYSALPITAAVNNGNDIVQPMYTNVNSVNVDLSKSNGKVVIKVTIVGLSGTTFSNGSIRLFKTSGSNTGIVTRWDRLSSSSSIFIFTDNSVTAESGNYQVNVSIKAVRNGVVESISDSDTI